LEPLHNFSVSTCRNRPHNAQNFTLGGDFAHVVDHCSRLYDFTRLGHSFSIGQSCFETRLL